MLKINIIILVQYAISIQIYIMFLNKTLNVMNNKFYIIYKVLYII